MDQKCLNPLPNLQIIEKQSLSTKKERKKAYSTFDRPPKAPVRSCPVSRTRQTSLFQNNSPRPVSFKDQCNTSFIKDNPMYISTKKLTYFEQCFTKQSTLGKGSFGEVFKVYSKETGQTYACKRTILQYRGESDRKRRIEEVKKHEEVAKHLNCVEFYRAWEEQNHLYLLTELCQSSLADVMASAHEFPENLMWSYLVDILQGLHHLHKHKLIHMDVKPDNIFIGTDGLCKLGDFGLVIDFSNGYPTEAVEGDPKYLAPECLQNIYTPAADVFSLGIVLLEMATDLFLPQAGPQWHELRKGTLPDVAQQKMSKDFQYIITGFLNPDHDQRFKTQQVLEEMKPIYRIAQKKRIHHYAQQKFCDAKKQLLSLLMWPYSFLLLLVSFISLGKYDLNLKSKSTYLNAINKSCGNDEDFFDHSDDEFICNLSYGDITGIEGPLTNSTPISMVKKKGLLSKFGASENPEPLTSTYSFHDSSFSSLEMSTEDLSRQYSNNESHILSPRSLLVSFNTAMNDDD